MVHHAEVQALFAQQQHMAAAQQRQMQAAFDQQRRAFEMQLRAAQQQLQEQAKVSPTQALSAQSAGLQAGQEYQDPDERASATAEQKRLQELKLFVDKTINDNARGPLGSDHADQSQNPF